MVPQVYHWTDGLYSRQEVVEKHQLGVACKPKFGNVDTTRYNIDLAGQNSFQTTRPGSGDDDILDGVSEEEEGRRNGTGERLSKRRKMSDAYPDQGAPPAVSYVSHLLSAAMASGTDK